MFLRGYNCLQHNRLDLVFSFHKYYRLYYRLTALHGIHTFLKDVANAIPHPFDNHLSFE